MINRRLKLPRLLLALSSRNPEGNDNQKPQDAQLDRVTPYQGNALSESSMALQ
jgi:hypothetical protein